jgi:hypothetical protein
MPHGRTHAAPTTDTRWVRDRPENTVLNAVLEAHAGAFFTRLDEQGASLLAFVHEEFERYLRRDRLEDGFLRVVCIGGRQECLLAFS